MGEHRAGFVAIVGPPNAGKSTLLNRLLGQKLAIVSWRPQTTRSRILGIQTLPDAQISWVDTPGVHDARKALNRALLDAVREAVLGCDLACVLIDQSRGWQPEHEQVLEALEETTGPALWVATKTDLARRSDAQAPPERVGGWPELGVSARTGKGIGALQKAVVGQLPVSPPLYGPDEVTDRPLRWLAGECVREALFECIGQELPYQVAVEVVDFDESRPGLTAIRANIIVARESQKRIVVGSAGTMVKRVGMRARPAIEELVGEKVYLELFVKIEPRWLKNPRRIERLGYS